MAGAVDDPDDDGLDLIDIAQARIESVRFAADVLHDHPECIWSGEELRVEIKNGEDAVVCTIVIVGVDAPAQKTS